MNDLGIAPNPGPFSQGMLDMVAGVFPSVPIAQVKFLLEVNGNDPDAATNLILEGVSLPSLLSLLTSSCVDEDETSKIVLEEYHGGNPERLVEAAVTFYKGTRFNPRAEVRVCIENQPAMDAGGVRRQFMSDVLARLATSQAMQLFGIASGLFSVRHLLLPACSPWWARWWDTPLCWTGRDSRTYLQHATTTWLAGWRGQFQFST